MVGDLRSMSLLQSLFYSFPGSRADQEVVGIPSLTEANREKATHQEMINSMKR